MPTARRPHGRPALKVLGVLEVEILRILWQRGRSTAREVQEVLAAERRFAYTTVAKVLNNLTVKGLLVKEAEIESPGLQRAYRHFFAPTLDEKALVLFFVKDLCQDVGLDAAEQRHVGRLLSEA